MKEKIGKKPLREGKTSKHSINSKHNKPKTKKNTRDIDDDDNLDSSKRSYIKLKQPKNIEQDNDNDDNKKVGKIKQ